MSRAFFFVAGMMWGLLIGTNATKPLPAKYQLKNPFPPYQRSRAIRVEPRVNILFRIEPSKGQQPALVEGLKIAAN